MQRAADTTGGERVLYAALLLLAAVILLEPAGSSPRRARRDAVRRDPARDARRPRPRRSAPERPALLREAAAALLGQRGVLPGLRSDALGGPPSHPPRGARHHAAARAGRGPASARRSCGGHPAAGEPDRFPRLANEPDRRPADVLLHGHAAGGARGDPPQGVGRRMARARRGDRRGGRRRVPHEGPGRARAAGRHSSAVVPGHRKTASPRRPRRLARARPSFSSSPLRGFSSSNGAIRASSSSSSSTSTSSASPPAPQRDRGRSTTSCRCSSSGFLPGLPFFAAGLRRWRVSAGRTTARSSFSSGS